MYTRACISFRLSPGGWLSLAVLRLTPLYDHLRIRLCPAHVPDRLPSNPLSDAGVYSRTKHQGRMARALDRGMQRVTERCERIPNSLLSLARSFLPSFVRSFVRSLARSLRSTVSFRPPLSPFLVIGACFSMYTADASFLCYLDAP